LGISLIPIGDFFGVEPCRFYWTLAIGGSCFHVY
jgi:hypothetical protein